MHNHKVYKEKILIRQLGVRCLSLHLRTPQANVCRVKVAKIVSSNKTKVWQSHSLNNGENCTRLSHTEISLSNQFKGYKFLVLSPRLT